MSLCINDSKTPPFLEKDDFVHIGATFSSGQVLEDSQSSRLNSMAQ